jgi:ABC-type sulfate/molybdate transport systems ATPase subunit
MHNLAAPLRFQNIRESREELIRKNLKLVGLEEFAKRRARELSGGEKKRVAIARALMTEPDVLLLDEPDANVDAATSRELEKLILTLRDRGMTVILCSHHKGFAYRTSDRIIDLYKGRPVDHDENIFKGRYSYREGLHSCFDTGRLVMSCPARLGEFSTTVIAPENITLSRKNSAGENINRLRAVVVSICPYKTGQFTITLDCQGHSIKTRVSDSELSLHKYSPEEELDVLFSPSAIQLY